MTQPSADLTMAAFMAVRAFSTSQPPIRARVSCRQQTERPSSMTRPQNRFHHNQWRDHAERGGTIAGSTVSNSCSSSTVGTFQIGANATIQASNIGPQLPP